ncbi:HTH-type transcriptional regulator BetI [Paraconexibacter sp. AEG42_29]|uniref:HTH-type transcriptional regulator BetI n=1 Tax=Paraconexibacter sp. AEG42_29 TaxID=2997339 RepID=A0AAU7B1R4_9ACTN
MPAPRNPGRTRGQILDAALGVLADRGHAGTTMQRVADAAGVDKALLHYYFTSKAGLLSAAVMHLGDRLLADVEAAVAGLDDPADVVEIGFGTMWDHVTADPRLHAVWLSLYAAAITDPVLAETVGAVRARYREMVRARLLAMVAAGWRSSLSDSALVMLVVASIDGFTVALLEDGRTPALDEAIAATQEMVRALIERP